MSRQHKNYVGSAGKNVRKDDFDILLLTTFFLADGRLTNVLEMTMTTALPNDDRLANGELKKTLYGMKETAFRCVKNEIIEK